MNTTDNYADVWFWTNALLTAGVTFGVLWVLGKA